MQQYRSRYPCTQKCPLSSLRMVRRFESGQWSLFLNDNGSCHANRLEHPQPVLLNRINVMNVFTQMGSIPRQAVFINILRIILHVFLPNDLKCIILDGVSNKFTTLFCFSLLLGHGLHFLSGLSVFLHSEKVLAASLNLVTILYPGGCPIKSHTRHWSVPRRETKKGGSCL